MDSKGAEQTGSGTKSTVTRKRKIVPSILDGKYFEIISSADNSVKAKCLTCACDSKKTVKVISGAFQPTSNFSTHLQRTHPETFKEYERYKSSVEIDLKRSGQSQISFPINKEAAFKSKSERLIVKYIVSSMSPLSTVEQTSFRDLVRGLNPEAVVMCRNTLTTKINHEFTRIKNITKKDLASTAWVCITTDIWSSRHRSFLGVTAHWLDLSLSRKSAILSLQRFAGRHTSDKIIEKLTEIVTDFGIKEKLVAVVTDNGSNFVKALRDYGLEPEIETADMLEDEDELELDDVIMETAISLDGLVMEGVSLPRHFRCASHTLSLVATEDFDTPARATEENSTSQATRNSCKKIMRAAMGKCSALWNKIGRSVQAAETAKDTIGVSLPRPVVVRWNSLYDAVNVLLKFRDMLECLFGKLNVEKLKHAEIEYLQCYETAMQPVAWALDKLQQEEDFYFGFLAPTIWKTVRDLMKIGNQNKGFSDVLARDLKGAMDRRFVAILELDTDAAEWEIMAAVLMPCFKLKWIPFDSRERVKRFFVEKAKEFSLRYPCCTAATENENSDTNKWSMYYEDEEVPDDFSRNNIPSNVELTCLTYLEDARDTLNVYNEKKFELLKRLFVYYNTALASSAAAERLFSYGGMILRPRRSRLSDEMFEKLVILKLCKSL